MEKFNVLKKYYVLNIINKVIHVTCFNVLKPNLSQALRITLFAP